MSWVNVACTTYDVCVTLREVFLHDASSLAIFDSILKGMVIDQLVNCLLGGHVKIIAKAIMACKGLGDQVDTIKADIERGDPVAAGFHALQLITMIFSIMAQCFTGKTEVMTDEGLVAIEDIEVGDYVLAEDTVTGEQEYKEVLNVFVSQTNKLVYVTTADKNSETNTETNINTTDNHPFYVEGKGWVPAIEIEAGDELRTANGEIETVSKVEVEYLDEPVLIYNLEVEGYHTYFVSDESVLVHNTYDSGDSNAELDNDKGKTRETASPSDLNPTHATTLSKNKYKALVVDIRMNGIKETIKFVDYDGKMYVVDGHHRLRAARELGLTDVPVEKVELPYLGYETVDDLLWYE